jgi:hypothetical protein
MLQAASLPTQFEAVFAVAALSETAPDNELSPGEDVPKLIETPPHCGDRQAAQPRNFRHD